MSAPLGLLDAIVRDALDPSYVEAAQRREKERLPGSATPASATSRRWIGAGLMLAAGAIAGLAVSFQHRVIPQVGAARSALAGDATTRTNQVVALEREVAKTQREVAALQAQQLQATKTGRELQNESTKLAAAVAQTAVTGPGITVTVSDATLAPANGVVTDRELQGVVNALWAGGANAISVAGVRLGPQTAIRTAGRTILADFQALRSPYVVSAIGSPRLLAAVQRSSAIVQLGEGTSGTHPEVTIAASARLSLPAATGTAVTAIPVAGGHS